MALHTYFRFWPPELKDINLCCSQPVCVCGSLLQQPQDTDTGCHKEEVQLRGAGALWIAW